jgi:acyl-CoA-binding protein
LAPPEWRAWLMAGLSRDKGKAGEAAMQEYVDLIESLK